MDLISPEQCRAARALLNWSQPDLADKCGMHPQTISSFESNIGSPTKTTIGKIYNILTRAGVEFLPNHGVSLAENSFYVSGDYSEILEDCLNTLQPGDEVLSHCADDRRSSQQVMDLFAELHKKGIILRATTCAGNDKRLPFRQYRNLPDDFFNVTQLTVIYADKFAIHLDGDKGNYRHLTVRNKTLANVMRQQFEYWWNIATQKE